MASIVDRIIAELGVAQSTDAHHLARRAHDLAADAHFQATERAPLVFSGSLAVSSSETISGFQGRIYNVPCPGARPGDVPTAGYSVAVLSTSPTIQSSCVMGDDVVRVSLTNPTQYVQYLPDGYILVQIVAVR